MSNYEKMKIQVREDFLRYDQEEIIQKTHVEYDESYFYITFVSRLYRINRKNGQVCWSEDDFVTEQDADYNEVMTIYDVLCYSKSGCKTAGEFVNMGSLSRIQGGTQKLGDGFFHKLEKTFEHKLQELAAACELLGGQPYGKGDVAYKLPLFDFMPMMFQFWDSDEEFPPSLQLFLDKNILDFMHYETVWFAMGHVLARLEDEMRYLTSKQ